MTVPEASSSAPARTPETPGPPLWDHRTRRLFIGPLPDKLLAVMHEVIQVVGNDNDESLDASYASAVRDVLDRNARAFFLRQGGREEDWNDGARENVRDELMKQWQESPWMRPLWHTTHRVAGASHWVGITFEVGSILGVNMLDSHAPAPAAPLVVPEAPQRGAQAPNASTTALSSIGPRSYWTARSHLAPPSSPSLQGSSSTASLPEQVGGELSAFSSGSPLLATASSPSFPTDHVPQQGRNAPRSILKNSTGTSSGKPGTKRRGVSLLDRGAKRKVHLRPKENIPSPNSVDAMELPLGGDQADEGPASPTAVLARTGNEVVECSAGATAPSQEAPGDIFLRGLWNVSKICVTIDSFQDRMLVRVCYTKSESLTCNFDEVQNRQTTYLRHEDCMEFLVVWRKDMLELYEDYTIPGKEYIMGHKHLSFVIPLASERTSVSLYSFVDLTFCILCPPTPVRDRNSKARSLFQISKDGTNVFVFKVKSRTRARDWLWHLWRRLGGKIPTSIDIRCPDVDMRICIDVPAPEGFDLGKAYDTFSHRNIIDLLQRSLSSEHGSSSVLKNWKTSIERELRAGRKLELAWRFGGQLDWVWQEQDVDGNPRLWAVLSGLSLWQGLKPAHLELRIAKHFPDCIHLQSGEKVFEPPAVEGYLDRIRQQSRQRVYLVTHDGNLFSLLPSDANPPIPPSAHLSRLMSGKKPNVEEYSQSLFESEVWRGAEQIHTAQGTLDLRSIRTVRRAYDPLSQDDGEQVAQDEVDARDVGGHQGHVHVHDKVQLHLRRTFDVVLASGPVIRFEAHSAHDCIEWVTRLRALVAHWSERHRADVKEEMNVAYATSTRARLTPRMPKCAYGMLHSTTPEPPMNSESPVSTSLYNWCSLSTCRSIVKAGRVFMRAGLRGQYKLVQLFLVPGRLIRFNVSPTSALHHRSSKDVGLLDAYVCSGYFAALALRPSEYSPESPNLPRRYHDGLETDEREEDKLFVIWYRKSSASAQAASWGKHSNAPAGGFQPTQPIPRLSKGSHKLVVFRTRSKVERDAWCWALGCEIEKVVRNNRDRERKVREAGGLVELLSC